MKIKKDRKYVPLRAKTSKSSLIVNLFTADEEKLMFFFFFFNIFSRKEHGVTPCGDEEPTSGDNFITQFVL